MFSSSLLKRVAAVVAALHFMLVAQIPMAQAAMIGTPEVIAEQQQQVDRQQLLTMLDDQDVQKKLESMGVDRTQVEKRINSLNPRRTGAVQPAARPGPPARVPGCGWE